MSYISPCISQFIQINSIHVLQMIQHNLSRLGDIQLYIFNQFCNLALDKLTIQTNHLIFDISHTYPYQIPNSQYINSINFGTICSNSNNSNNLSNSSHSNNSNSSIPQILQVKPLTSSQFKGFVKILTIWFLVSIYMSS